ncbi:LuxR C-terminal-related transcriptional regulator [Actinoplanes hulinensis]|uniref:LuxR C-terminal-related transcriptional regulator n=1 Tax=Actinoplanes hulinensis TaxID=1144547 RepID=A0ABS7BA66_9ACTN|nr:LuxR family transcriptional regulator [Actinoplanes hulinensis]MBW6437319.1 LuxR C-terminal-related transcriptional regulator [Actinoplanes hulinensis]
MLDALGLTPADQRVYAMWLRHPQCTAAEIARRLGATEDEVTVSRRALIGAGILIADTQRPDRLTPVAPDVVVDRRLADIEAAAARQRAQAMQARVHLSALMAQQMSGDGGDLPGQRIRGRLRQAKLDELVRGARGEIVALQAGRPTATGLTGASTGLDRRVLRRGVAIRVLYPHDRLARGDDVAHVRRLAGDGAEVRTTARVPAAALVVDRAAAALFVDGDDGETEMLVLIDHVVAGTLAALFESCWGQAQPLGAPVDGLSGNDRTLLQLLALGATDETAARSMGVSVRTVRRHVSLLLDRLQAVSRFQAGVQAAQRGWL